MNVAEKNDKKDKKDKKEKKKDKKAKLEAPRELAPLGSEKQPLGLSPAMQAARGSTSSAADTHRNSLMDNDNDDSRESSTELGHESNDVAKLRQRGGVDESALESGRKKNEREIEDILARELEEGKKKVEVDVKKQLEQEREALERHSKRQVENEIRNKMELMR